MITYKAHYQYRGQVIGDINDVEQQQLIGICMKVEGLIYYWCIKNNINVGSHQGLYQINIPQIIENITCMHR